MACVSRFEAIKSEAEKLRDETIQAMLELTKVHPSWDGVYGQLYDEFVAGKIKPRELTPEVIEKLVNKHLQQHPSLHTYNYTELVAAYVRGELEL